MTKPEVWYPSKAITNEQQVSGSEISVLLSVSSSALGVTGERSHDARGHVSQDATRAWLDSVPRPSAIAP